MPKRASVGPRVRGSVWEQSLAALVAVVRGQPGPPWSEHAMHFSELEASPTRIARVEFALLVATAILSSLLVEGALLLQ